MLSRRQQAKILVYCMNKFYPQCARRKNLFSEKDADDLVEEVGVHVWLALIRYRDKPYKQALKLAFRSGQNRLNSIVRTRLTVEKRGAKIRFAAESADDIYWLACGGLQSNGVQVVDTMETLVSHAIMRVGVRRAPALIKALLYNWRFKPDRNQLKIMKILNKTRVQTRKLVERFTNELRPSLSNGQFNPYDNMLEKKDGKWVLSKKQG